MKNLSKLLRWVALRVVFSTCLYWGTVGGVSGAANVAQFYIGFVLVVATIFVLFGKWPPKDTSTFGSVMRAANVAFNIPVIVILIWFGWTFSAFAWAMSWFMAAVTQIEKANPAAGASA